MPGLGIYVELEASFVTHTIQGHQKDWETNAAYSLLGKELQINEQRTIKAFFGVPNDTKISLRSALTYYLFVSKLRA